MEFGLFKGLFKGREAQGITTPLVEDLPEATRDIVRARREANGGLSRSQGRYEVKKELVVPNKYHLGQAHLAPLVITASSVADGGSWMITAALFTTAKDYANGNRFQPPLGRMEYEGEPISIQQAFDLAREWIRDSSVLVTNEIEIPMSHDRAGYTGAFTVDVSAM
jgi:hypothetical protein